MDPSAVPAPDASLPGLPQADKPRKRVRSAWISFVSRILAQLLGAAATVALGVAVLQRYQVSVAGPANPGTLSPPAAQAPAAERNTGRVSIAVLPFENYSGDPRRDHLADALTDGVVCELSQVSSWRVVSRTSSMHYRGARKKLPEIGRELGVDLVVEGSFVGDGERLRVIAQLIDARRDEHVWATSYQRPAHDAMALQRDLAAAIARDIERTLKESPQWQALLPASWNAAPATGRNSQR
jgi:TolB-like protein